MTTKKATKRAPAQKLAPKKLTVAQRNAEAFKILQLVVEKAKINDYCEEGQSILRRAADTVDSRKFKSGTLGVGLDEFYLNWDDIKPTDDFEYEIHIKNKRTGKVQIETGYTYNTDIEMDDE
jgi:hypothetical protein